MVCPETLFCYTCVIITFFFQLGHVLLFFWMCSQCHVFLAGYMLLLLLLPNLLSIMISFGAVDLSRVSFVCITCNAWGFLLCFLKACLLVYLVFFFGFGTFCVIWFHILVSFSWLSVLVSASVRCMIVWYFNWSCSFILYSHSNLICICLNAFLLPLSC